MSDLIKSLLALAAGRHDDLSIAVDAVIEIRRQCAENERLRAANKQLAEGIDNISRRNREEIAELREDNYRLRADRRERIATAALQGLIAHSYGRGPSREAAEVALELADALIAELDKEPQP